MRRVLLAPLVIVAVVAALRAPLQSVALAQTAPEATPAAPSQTPAPPPPLSTPPPPPIPSVAPATPAGTPTAAATEAATPTSAGAPSAAPSTTAPSAAVPSVPAASPAIATPPAIATSPASASPAPVGTVPAEIPGASPSPTPPPIIVEPPQASVQPGSTITLRVNAVLGTISATVADPSIATVFIDQTARTIAVYGKALGTTTITVSDERGVTRAVPVRVAYNAGAVAESTTIRITGEPATAEFVRREAAKAAARAASTRPGAIATASPDEFTFTRTLPVDNVATVQVPVTISGEGYFTTTGTTQVRVENFALPRIYPSMLLVSDYPETLAANGTLFTATLERQQSRRFLYYHYNPPNSPSRRIVLKAENRSGAPALVQMIAGSAGPETNEMQVGHLSTERFLVHEAQNEGVVLSIPPNTTVNLVDHLLPARDVVSAILQLREVEGNSLVLTLVAQDANAPLDTPPATTDLLSGGVPHARGAYPVPQFFFEATYPTDGPNLEIPIGQLPLPNLRQGEALAGDYGVQQSITVRIINSGPLPAPVALYANPRGGRATGTFLIDRVLVQAHALPPFSHFKIWQTTVAPHTFRTVQVITMPEGGSSYPLRLIFAPDDGSIAPGAPGSPIY